MKKTTSQKSRTASRFRVIIILFGMLAVILVTAAIALFLFPFSSDLASRTSYSDIAFMRVPVLILSESVILLFLIACLLSIPLLIHIYRGKPFTGASVRLLHWMELCFYLMILPLAALVIYTQQHVADSITNLYCFLGMGLAFLAGNLFGLFAALIGRASEFEEEINLTI